MDTKACQCGSISFKFKVRVKTPDGWLSKTVPSLTLARKVEVRLKSQAIEAESLGLRKSPMIEVIWNRYLKFIKAHKKSWKDDQSRWNHHLKLTGRMDKINTHQLQGIIDGLELKPATKRQVFQVVNALYNWSIRQGLYHGDNPCKRVRLEKFDNRIIVSMTFDDIREFEESLRREDNRWAARVILFALYTGKRKSEILGLTWDCVDMAGMMATFKDTKNTETHTVPFNHRALGVLREAARDRMSDLVFPCSTGKYYHSLNRSWYRIRKAAGLSCRLHDLRHIYASALASSGQVDLFVLKELLGHKDIKMTQRYAHILNHSLKKGTEVFDTMDDF
jgi:integrase